MRSESPQRLEVKRSVASEAITWKRCKIGGNHTNNKDVAYGLSIGTKIGDLE